MPQIIHQIVGRTIQTRDVDDDPQTPRELREYTIRHKAEIIIDGRKRCTIADLKVGDEVIIGNGSREGFMFIEAKRLTSHIPVQQSDDLSKPKVLQLEEPPTPIGAWGGQIGVITSGGVTSKETPLKKLPETSPKHEIPPKSDKK